MPRRGGGWLREAVFLHARMPTPPRFARLPLPEEGARMILNRSLPHTYLRRNRYHIPEPRILKFESREEWLETRDKTRRHLTSDFYPPIFGHRPIYIRGEAATRALSPSYQSTHSTFLPPSFGRRCPEGAEVGSRSGIFTHGDANPASLRSSAPSRGRGENDS